MKQNILSLLGFCFVMITCSNPNTLENPAWVYNFIVEFKTQPVGNPPQSIWKYTYENQIYYFVPAQCCDQFSSLYDEEGSVICSPDEGIHGNGSGDCPDFVENLKNAELIWKDSRER